MAKTQTLPAADPLSPLRRDEAEARALQYEAAIAAAEQAHEE